MPAPLAPSRRQPLSTLNKPAPGRPRPRPKAAPQKATCCDDPSIVDEGDSKVCANCGTQISESNIVADVTFEEDARGAATVQGGFIGENARHARTLGTGAYRKIGGGERNSLQEIENNGRRALTALCPRLGIPQNIADQAQALFGAAARLNFSAGRRTDEVIAACLFTACKRQPGNSVLLMDIAEVVKINVFRLGEVYKALCDKLHYHDEYLGPQQIVDIEPLIQKYCRKLEFGSATRDVATDAVRILKRMDRDWITTGRHPAGLCGACIILAARMNNFRRSVREVVYVAKVCDMTIAKRVEEFRRTRASALTVEQFREYGTRLKHSHDPPVLHYTELQKGKFAEKKRKREEAALARESPGGRPAPQPLEEESIVTLEDNSDNESLPGTPREDEDRTPKRRRRNGSEGSPTGTQQPPRFDTDGFAIPALPGPTPGPDDESAATPAPKRRGRPRKKRPEPVQISEDELSIEADLSYQIDQALHDSYIERMTSEAEKAKREEEAAAILEKTRPLVGAELEAEKDRERQWREAEGVDFRPDDSLIIGPESQDQPDEDEFANDPEVMNCLLNDEESRIKEKIWVANNEDWLRAQHEKDLIKKIAEAANADKEKSKRGKKGGTRKKRGRVGDRSVLEEADTPIETPADATSAMLKKRAGPGFSKYIDYESLARVYKKKDSPSSTTSQSRAGSETPSVSASHAEDPIPVAGVGADTLLVTPEPQPRAAAVGLQTPQATQAVTGATAPAAPSRANQPHGPTSPPPTQAQPTEGGGEEDQQVYEQDDEDEAGQSDGDVAPGGWDGGGDAGEEYGGEDDYEDYNRAIDPENFYVDETGGDDGDYF